MKLTPTTTGTLTGEARIQAIAAARKAKHRAFLEANHFRTDGWTEPEHRHQTAERMVRASIRRIEFPKFGDPFIMSETDRADAEAAGMLACVDAGFYEHGFVTRKLSRSIRNAIRGRNCLRQQCTHERKTGTPELLAAEVGFTTEVEEIDRRLTHGQRDMARELMRTLRASFAADGGRKAVANFRSQRNFFLIVLSQLTGSTPRCMDAVTFRKRTERFLDYLAKGAEHLRRNRLQPPSLANQIMDALRARALA